MLQATDENHGAEPAATDNAVQAPHECDITGPACLTGTFGLVFSYSNSASQKPISYESTDRSTTMEARSDVAKPSINKTRKPEFREPPMNHSTALHFRQPPNQSPQTTTRTIPLGGAIPSWRVVSDL